VYIRDIVHVYKHYDLVNPAKCILVTHVHSSHRTRPYIYIGVLPGRERGAQISKWKFKYQNGSLEYKFFWLTTRSCHLLKYKYILHKVYNKQLVYVHACMHNRNIYILSDTLLTVCNCMVRCNFLHI